MPITQAELDNIANSTLEYYIDLGNKKAPVWQHLENKPLLKKLRKGQEKFPGGNDFNISIPVIMETTTSFQGYTHDDVATYGNPANTKRAVYQAKELHAGLEVTETELKRNGIAVIDDQGGNTSQVTKAEKVQLQNVLKNKLRDLTEGSMTSLDSMLHLDGSQSAKEVAGIQAIVLDNPTAAGTTIGGIDTTLAANAAFRNRHSVDNSITGNNNGGTDDRIDVTGGALITKFIQTEMRQLRRYGGRPNLALCGSDFLDQLIAELLANGNYTQKGWSSNGATDIEVADIHYGNMVFQYDPSLDNIGTVVANGVEFSKRCYILDTDHVKLHVMDGYDMKSRRPDRPAEKYAIYRAINWTGAMCNDMPNSCGVYEFK